MPTFTYNIEDSDSDATVGIPDGTDAQPPAPFVADESQDIIYKENSHQEPVINNNRRETPSQEIAGIFRLLGESNNNNNNVNSLEENQKDDNPVVSLTQKETRYPSFQDLMTKYPDAGLQLFKAVDDSGAASCTMASDKAHPKANAWAKMLDICHGGGARGRGSMSRFGYQAITKATAMKKKILDMWKYGRDNKDKVSPEIYNYAVRQLQEHENAKSIERSNANKQKADAKKQQENMVAHQMSVNARPDGAGKVSDLPPAARGQVGGGRGQHSTNANLGQTATFSFAHLQSTEQNLSPLTTATNNNNNSNGNNTPKTPGRHSVSPTRGTAAVHNNALSDIRELSHDMRSFLGGVALRNNGGSGSSTAGSSITTGGTKRERKIEDLERLSKRLKDDALFYQSQGKKEQYEDSMKEYEETSKKLRALYKED